MRDYISVKMLTLTIWAGAIGSMISNWFGGWGVNLETLLCFMVIDFAMGLLLAIFWSNSSKSNTGALQSGACFRGLVKKGVALVFVIIGHRLDITFGFDYVRNGVIIAFTLNELISMVENAGLMGFPMPKIITNVIDILKQKSEGVGTNEDRN